MNKADFWFTSKMRHTTASGMLLTLIYPTDEKLKQHSNQDTLNKSLTARHIQIPMNSVL